MDFYQLCRERQSCRNYDPDRIPDNDAVDRILNAARLSPSACNGQPYHVTLCRDDAARAVASAVMGMGMNKFCKSVPLFLVISEEDYVPSAAVGAKIKKNDYRSMDIGILAATICYAATEEGLGSCILGWLDDGKLQELLKLNGPARLVIALGYAEEGDPLRDKKRKPLSELVSEK